MRPSAAVEQTSWQCLRSAWEGAEEGRSNRPPPFLALVIAYRHCRLNSRPPSTTIGHPRQKLSSSAARSIGCMENHTGSELRAAIRRIGLAADSSSSSDRKGWVASSPSMVRISRP